MTHIHRIDVLKKLGFTPRESEFLLYAALHGGYFMRRQYDRFVGIEHRGGTSQRLLDKLGLKYVKRALSAGNISIYHLCSKPFYAALGQENNRNRRGKMPRVIRQRLMILDYVLDHRQYQYFATEDEKREFFTPGPLPTTVYASKQSDAKTERYFVDKNPVWIDPATGIPAVAYVDEGQQAAAGFETWLRQYKPFLLSQPAFRVVYVSNSEAHVYTAERRFHAAFPSVDEPQTGEIAAHFADRLLVETRQFSTLGTAGFERFRQQKWRYSEPQHEQLYLDWKANGSRLSPSCGSLSTYVLAYDYNLFQGATAERSKYTQFRSPHLAGSGLRSAATEGQDFDS